MILRVVGVQFVTFEYLVFPVFSLKVKLCKRAASSTFLLSFETVFVNLIIVFYKTVYEQSLGQRTVSCKQTAKDYKPRTLRWRVLLVISSTSEDQEAADWPTTRL